jgi:hypothetical protein
MNGSKRRGLVIQERDLHLFRELTILRVIDREQTKLVAGFRSTTRVNARLLALTRAGLLRRVFVGTIVGGRKAIYSLSAKSAALINSDFKGLSLKPGESLAGNLYLEHQLKINAVFLTVKYRPIPVPDTSFLRWIGFRGPLSRAIALIPDGYFELLHGSSVRPSFLEIDLGTESLGVWKKKIQLYLQLAISGEFRRLFRQPQFRVLIVTTTDRRLQNLRSTVRQFTDKIFWFSTFKTINRKGFWSEAWLRPKKDQMHFLLKEY